MSYKGLEKARAERAAQEAAKKAKKDERGAEKAAKEAEEVTADKRKLGRNKIIQKGKRPEEADVPEPKAKVARMSEAQVEEDKIAPEPWRAPVAPMW